MTSYLSNQKITTTITLSSQNLQHSLIHALYDHLKKKVEGKCNDFGYVVKDTIQIVKKSVPKVVYLDNSSFLTYKIDYTCDIVQPSIGDEILFCVENKTDAGVISYVKYKDIHSKYKKDNELSDSPIVCIIPLDRFQNPEAIVKKQKIKVKINVVRIKFNNDNIWTVGTPIE